jgi:hypothetical protein
MIKSNSKIPERSKSEAKTAAILQGAMQEFLKDGYAAASMMATEMLANAQSDRLINTLTDSISNNKL